MDFLLRFKQHYLEVTRDRQLHECTLGFSLQQVGRITLTWFNTDDWKTISFPTRLFHVTFSLFCFVTWILLFTEGVAMEFNSSNIAAMARCVSIANGGFITCSRMVAGFNKRRALTDLLRDINDAVQVARQGASAETLEDHRLQYVLMLRFEVVTYVMICVGFIFTVAIYSLVLGDLFISVWLPVVSEPYTKYWYLKLVAAEIATVFSALVYTTQEAMFMDSFLQLAFCFKAAYKKLERLGHQSDEADKELLGWLAERINQLKALTSRLCDVMWLPQAFVWTTIYLILGLAAIAIETDKSISGSVSNAIYALYMLALTSLTACVGTFFESHANRLNEALFNSDWQDMSMANKKMMITHFIAGQERLMLTIPPLVDINVESLGNVLRRTYSTYALARNFLV